ncbi:MAG: HAMP domain-containing protein [Anaerobutyricum sp.]
MRNTTRKFAAGEYGVRAKTGSRDEVSELAKTFNYMAKTIEKKIASRRMRPDGRRILQPILPMS